MNEKKTYGQTMIDTLATETMDDDVIEYRRRMEPELQQKLLIATQNALKSPQYDGKDFYLVFVTTKERLMQGIKPLIWPRISCPTPLYYQSVWKYHRQSGMPEFLWSIPGPILYHRILNNAIQYWRDPETRELTEYVMMMESGELLRRVKAANGNKKDAVIRINNPKQEIVC